MSETYPDLGGEGVQLDDDFGVDPDRKGARTVCQLDICTRQIMARTS